MTESAHYFKVGKLKDAMAAVWEHIPTESVIEWEKHLEILIFCFMVEPLKHTVLSV